MPAPRAAYRDGHRAGWGVHPREEDLAWVGPEYQGPRCFAARCSYGNQYQSTGDWGFDATGASRFGLDAGIIS
jgi:hypothetical protein